MYRNGFIDDRVREFVPVVRVMEATETENAERLVGCKDIMTVIGSDNVQYTKVRNRGTLLLDYGVELHGGIRLINNKASGVTVRIRFGESVSEAIGEPNPDHGEHDAVVHVPFWGYLDFGSTGFRFVKINILAGEADFINIPAIATYRDLKRGGSFHCSDERLNKIWETGAYTLFLNLQEYILEGVKRDHQVWMGDLNPEIRTLLAVFNDASLVPKSLDFIRNYTNVKSPMNGIHAYSLWWIINQYTYYMARGDINYLKEQKDYLTELANFFADNVDEKGSEHVPEWRFLDWQSVGNTPAIHAGLQGLQLWALKCAAFMFDELGADSRKIRAVIAKMQQYVPDCGFSKPAAAMQILGGLADRQDVLLHDPFHGVSTFYGCFMLMAQPTANALELIRKYWGAMIDYGATTFWEDFDLDWLKNTSPITEFPVRGKDDLHADFGNYCYKGLRHSLCHGWASGPTPFLSERVLGIRFLKPGGREVSVKPDLAGLDFAEGTYPTAFGEISVKASKTGAAEIKVPDGVRLIQD